MFPLLFFALQKITACAASYDSCSTCRGGTCNSSCISNCSDICVDNSCSNGCRYHGYSDCRGQCTLTCIGSNYVYGCGGGCDSGCGSNNCKDRCIFMCYDKSCSGLATTIIFYITFNTIMIS